MHLLLAKTFLFCLAFLLAGPSSQLKPVRKIVIIFLVMMCHTILSLSALLLAVMLLLSSSFSSLTDLLSSDENDPNHLQAYNFFITKEDVVIV